MNWVTANANAEGDEAKGRSNGWTTARPAVETAPDKPQCPPTRSDRIVGAGRHCALSAAT